MYIIIFLLKYIYISQEKNSSFKLLQILNMKLHKQNVLNFDNLLTVIHVENILIYNN